MTDNDIVPTGFLDGLKEAQQNKNKEAWISVFGTEEQKALLLEGLALRISNRLGIN